MAVQSVTLPVAMERAFYLLEDPRTYSYIVVGTRTIRAFDPNWPDPHTQIHHSVGIGPLVIRDSTEVVEVQPPHLLVLEARFRPFGVVTVRFTLEPAGADTRLTVEETPRRGPVALPGFERVIDAAIYLRNWEMLRRIHRLVERRPQWRPAAIA